MVIKEFPQGQLVIKLDVTHLRALKRLQLIINFEEKSWKICTPMSLK